MKADRAGLILYKAAVQMSSSHVMEKLFTLGRHSMM